MKKDDLTAKCEELLAQNTELQAQLDAAPKGSSKELQDKVAQQQEEIDALKGVVADLNDQLRLADKTKGNPNPVGSYEKDGTIIRLQTNHAIKYKGEKLTTAQLVQRPDVLEHLHKINSTAVTVVG